MYGKPTYLGSRHYNYYTISKEGVKIPLKLNNNNCTDDRGCEEINDGQEITIPEYNGTFTANIYKNESQDIFPTYNLYTYFMNKLLIFYSFVILVLILLIVFLFKSKVQEKEKFY